MTKQTNKHLYTLAIAAPLLLGAVPAALTAFVDPYEFFGDRNRSTRLTDIAEKAHYPLWKLARYTPSNHETIVLGDSRARALRGKYWHELGLNRVLNLSYGGGIIPEIYETYQHIREDHSVKNLIIGIQLRSFDEDHKGGMNRVPEAIRIVGDKTEYLKNWFVAKTAWRLFQFEHADKLEAAADLIPDIVGKANAGELPSRVSRDLEALVDPKICFRCQLPNYGNSLRHGHSGPYNFAGFGRGYWHPFSRLEGSDWAAVKPLYEFDHFQQDLPKKHDAQVRKGGKADWRGFEFSSDYWKKIREISQWANQNGKHLIFVIPPTVTRLQMETANAGLGELNHLLRTELAKLGEVFDFDFPNELTANASHFTDAYHFNAGVARQIVGELAVYLDKKTLLQKRYVQHQNLFQCESGENNKQTVVDPQISLTNGLNCRIWRGLKS